MLVKDSPELPGQVGESAGEEEFEVFPEIESIHLLLKYKGVT